MKRQMDETLLCWAISAFHFGWANSSVKAVHVL